MLSSQVSTLKHYNERTNRLLLSPTLLANELLLEMLRHLGRPLLALLLLHQHLVRLLLVLVFETLASGPGVLVPLPPTDGLAVLIDLDLAVVFLLSLFAILKSL